METSVAQELMAKHGTMEKAAAAAGVGKSSIFRALHRTNGTGRTGRPTAVPQSGPVVTKSIGRSMSEFKQTYDKDTVIPKKIKEALRILGALNWEYETEFAKVAGVSMADMGTYRQHFMDLVVTLREGRKVWAGSKRLADEMRSLL